MAIRRTVSVDCDWRHGDVGSGGSQLSRREEVAGRMLLMGPSRYFVAISTKRALSTSVYEKRGSASAVRSGQQSISQCHIADTETTRQHEGHHRLKSEIALKSRAEMKIPLHAQQTGPADWLNLTSLCLSQWPTQYLSRFSRCSPRSASCIRLHRTQLTQTPARVLVQYFKDCL